MENTTAVIHGESAYQMKGQLVDENRQENTNMVKLMLMLICMKIVKPI